MLSALLILIVDEPEGDSLRELLADAGYLTLQARSERVALEHIRRNRPDLIVVGHELFANLVSALGGPTIPSNCPIVVVGESEPRPTGAEHFILRRAASSLLLPLVRTLCVPSAQRRETD